MAYIKLDSVSVDFPIYNMDARSIKKQFLKLSTGGKIGTNTQTNKVIVQALSDITLQIEDGDRIGLVGHNGAGKSTLLRVLAGIYEPTAGHIYVEGKVSPLLDVMLGVDFESTGYENIITRGILLGLSRKQINEKRREIAEFTELGDYLTVPMRTYSDGMKVRLAFAVATSIEPEVLVIDEVFGAGDSAFREKAKKRINGLINKSSIVVIASHDKNIIKKICNKALWLEGGKIRAFGSVEEIVAHKFG